MQLRLGGLALDGAVPRVVGVAQAHRRAACDFHGADMWQPGDLVRNACRCRFQQRDGDVAAQHLAELGVHQHGNGVTPEQAGDDDRHGHRDAEDRQPGAQRAALHGAQNHAQTGREPAPQPEALDQHGLVDAGCGWSHRLGRRQPHRGAHRIERCQQCRRQGHADGAQNQLGFDAVVQLGKAKDFGVDANKPVPERRAQRQSNRHAEGDDEQHQFQVVHADDPVVITECLQGGHLFALGGDLPAQHDVEQKARHRQEDARQHRSEHTLLFDLRIQDHVRHLPVAAAGAAAAIGREQAVQAVDHRAFAGAGRQTHGDLIERAFHVVGRCQRAPLQPEDAKTTLIG